MTTHDTHFEHSDVESSVVEHSPVVEMPTPSSETTEPVQETTETSLMKEQQTEPAIQVEQVQGAPSQMEETSPADTQNQAAAPITETISTAFADTQATASEIPGSEVASELAEVSSPPSSGHETSLVDAFVAEEEVRPFTDFIEEFRQAEARFSSSLQAYQKETSTTLEDVATETASPQEELLASIPVVEAEAGPESQVTDESAEQKTAADATSERPVSPLLRPATRMRLPRHGGGRHREEVVTNKPVEPETPSEEAEVKAEPEAPEPPRPARRYRFDRPAAATSNGVSATSPAVNVPSASQAQSRTEEGKEVSARGKALNYTRPENGHAPNGQAVEMEAQAQPQARSSSTQAPEQSISKDAVAESSAGEASATTSPAPEHERRKRHSQDRPRGKEQASQAAAPAAVPAEVTPAVQEPTTPEVEETSAEDLPPLEYAELQKASSRRRRRRHTNGHTVTPAAAAGKANTPETPPLTSIVGPAATPSVAVPRTPAASVTAPNQFAITSGYTVKQMNQGQDSASPFMGPDPSPARGSIAAQNVRSIRSDVQRTPAYPVRTTEANAASVHQLANIVAQAIQTQTDRMISELRRANQSPTNVSVSMPPFPSTERVGVFVDVANLLYSARNLRMTVDFGKLLDFLRGNRRLVRAQAYCPTSPQPGDEQMFLQAVKGLGYRITTKNYKTFSSGAKKADLDLDLCMDVVRLVDGKAVDCIVLVSGDSDFMPMLDYCSDHGVRVEVAAFDESMSATLRQSCDLFINLGMLEEIRA
ncbi:MAG TPA: NYN domain-containing protein [Ktedonobacteraceae bacterium]|nr:NYN domain-containing protein [Ktedonobacteraceae bacterium]